MTASIDTPRTEQICEQPSLFVDLDGSLVRTDTLLECIIALSSRPLSIVRGLLALSHGKARMKQEIAVAADLNPALLPYNEELLGLLRAEFNAGRSLVLATGADRKIASAVADYLCIFDAVVASDGTTNMTGERKLAAIRRTVGDRPFAYAGNHPTDLVIWREAQSGIVVNNSRSLRRAAERVTDIEAAVSTNPVWPRLLLLLFRAMRPHQWSKNLLVFVPIVTARAFDELHAWAIAVLMFVAFSCAASGTYLINDLHDLAADRQHSRKRQRPFAAGVLPLHVGLAASPLLWVAAIGLGVITGTLSIILLYIFASVLYAFYFKQWPLVDIFLLAGLYTLRLFGGGAATEHRVSLWLLAFSSFLFLSLAIVKRVSELMALAPGGSALVAGRGYRPSDAAILQVMGVASSFVACMVLALYVQSQLNPGLDIYPTLSWALIPLMLFWQCRIWLATSRGNMHDDPIVFAARDWVSWLVVICSVVVLLFGNRVSI